MPNKKPVFAVSPTAPHDSLAENRRLEVAAVDLIPPVPAGFVATAAEERQRRLNRPADSLRAEIRSALGEVIGRKATYRRELGDVPPDVAVAETLSPRLAAIKESLEAAEYLVTYLRELEAIAYSDAANFLQAVDDEVRHRARKNGELTAAYAHVLLVSDGRGNAIAEGMARSRRDAEDAGSTAEAPGAQSSA